MTGQVIHLLQEVIVKEVTAAQVILHRHLPQVEVVVDHPVVAIHPEVAAVLPVEVVTPQVEVKVHQEVEGNI